MRNPRKPQTRDLARPITQSHHYRHKQNAREQRNYAVHTCCDPLVSSSCCVKNVSPLTETSRMAAFSVLAKLFSEFKCLKSAQVTAAEDPDEVLRTTDFEEQGAG